jgi:TRAP-type C4-dicarboxylate transport system permease small subunit
VKAGRALLRASSTVAEWLARAELVLVALMLLVALLITAYAIVARNAGLSTGDWALSLPEVLLVWMTVLAAGALVTRRTHVAADFIVERLPPVVRRALRVLLALGAIGVLAVLAWGGFHVAMQLRSAGLVDSEVFNLPKAAEVAVIPLGLGLCILHLLVEIARELSGTAGAGERPWS